MDEAPMSQTLFQRVGHVAPGTTLVALTSGIDSALPGQLAHFTTGGSQVVVVYADPTSFDGSATVSRLDLRGHMESFAGANTAPFVLTANPGGALILESAQDARYFEQ